VSPDQPTGRSLTSGQSQYLYRVLRDRMEDLHIAFVNIWPVSPNTVNGWRDGVEARAVNWQMLESSFWIEPGTLAKHVRDPDNEPLRTLPAPTPFQREIFDRRTRQKMSYDQVAQVAGTDDQGRPWLSTSTVFRLERTPPERTPNARSLTGLSKGLGIPEANLRHLLAQSIGDLDEDSPVLDAKIRALVDQLQELPEVLRDGAVEAATRMVEAMVKWSSDQPGRPSRIPDAVTSVGHIITRPDSELPTDEEAAEALRKLREGRRDLDPEDIDG